MRSVISLLIRPSLSLIKSVEYSLSRPVILFRVGISIEMSKEMVFSSGNCYLAVFLIPTRQFVTKNYLEYVQTHVTKYRT